MLRIIIGFSLLKLCLYRQVWDIAAASDPKRYILSADVQDDPASEFEDLGKTHAKLISPLIDENSVVLDFGIGSGRVERYLPKCKRLVGVDISPRMLRLARERLESLEQVSLIRIGRDFTLSDTSFDFVFSLGVLHHMPEAEARRILDRLIKSLKHGGSFYFTVSGVRPKSWLDSTYQSYDVMRARHLLPPEGIIVSIEDDGDITVIGHRAHSAK